MLPNKNTLFAFSLSAGHREQNRVVSIDLKKLTIGQLSSSPSNELLIKDIFAKTKYKIVYEKIWMIILFVILLSLFQ